MHLAAELGHAWMDVAHYPDWLLCAETEKGTLAAQAYEKCTTLLRSLDHTGPCSWRRSIQNKNKKLELCDACS